MRDIAESAEVSLGLAYRYFKNKEEVVAKLYQKVGVEIDEETDDITPGPLSKMFRERLRIKMAVLGKHERLFKELVPQMIDRDSLLSTLNPKQAKIRSANQMALLGIVKKANITNDIALDVTELVALLYLIEMVCTLIFLLRPGKDLGFEGPLEAVETGLENLHLLKDFPTALKILKQTIEAFSSFAGKK